MSILGDRDGYLYIIKTRECIRMEEEVYKVGRTEDIVKRIKQYPKGSIILYTVYTTNIREGERGILNELDEYKRKDLGNEYIACNLTMLKGVLDRHVNIIDKREINNEELEEEDDELKNADEWPEEYYNKNKITKFRKARLYWSLLSTVDIDKVYDEFRWWWKENICGEGIISGKIPEYTCFVKNIKCLMIVKKGKIMNTVLIQEHENKFIDESD